MEPEAFDAAPGGKKNLRVHLVVQPTGGNPWRTRQDYIDDQRRVIVVCRWTIAAAMSAVATAVATLVTLLLQRWP